MDIELTLTTAGADTGPFDLYSDVDSFTTPFETGVLKSALVAGYTSSLAPSGTTTVRVQSTGLCTNFIDIVLVAPTTTTTTTLVNTFTNGSETGSLNVTSGSGYSVFLNGSPFTMSPNPLTVAFATVNMSGTSQSSSIGFTLGGSSEATAFTNMQITDGTNIYNAVLSGGLGTGNNVSVQFNIGSTLGRTFTWYAPSNNELNLAF